MSYTPEVPLGQATKAASLPVTLASDEDALPITDDGGSLTVDDGGTTLSVDDGGSSLTVDQSGTWTVQPGNTANTTAWKVDGSAVTQPVSGTVTATVALPTGASTAALQTQPGVDIGDVTINNASGASAVNVQDGGNSLTVDGTVAATQSGTWNVLTSSATSSMLVAGSKTNNAAAPSTNNVGALVGIANAAAPTYTEGDQVLLSTDLAGAARVAGTVTANAGTNLNTSALALDATLTGGTQLAKLYDGTQSANTFAGDSGQNALLVGTSRKEVTTALSTSNTTAVDCSNYTWVSVHCTAYTSGTLTFQCSNDNSNWVSNVLYNSATASGATNAATMTATGVFHGPIAGRYFRITGGVATVTVEFLSLPRMPSGMAVSVTGASGGKTNNNAAPGATNLGVIPGIANAAAPTWTEGNLVLVSTDLAGAQRIIQMASATGGYSYGHMATNTTTTHKSGAGFLHTITINTKGAVTTATVYDNTAGSGTTIAVLDTTLSQDTLTYDLAFATGLTIVTAGTTACDLTVTYK